MRSNAWVEVPISGREEVVLHDYQEDVIFVVLDTLISEDSRIKRVALKDVEVADTPQTGQKEDPVGCSRNWSVSCTSCDRYFNCDYLSGKQTESTGSPIGDYRDGVGAWQTDCAWREPHEADT